MWIMYLKIIFFRFYYYCFTLKETVNNIITYNNKAACYCMDLELMFIIFNGSSGQWSRQHPSSPHTIHFIVCCKSSRLYSNKICWRDMVKQSLSQTYFIKINHSLCVNLIKFKTWQETSIKNVIMLGRRFCIFFCYSAF